MDPEDNGQEEQEQDNQDEQEDGTEDSGGLADSLLGDAGI